jgi:hypothetical protein
VVSTGAQRRHRLGFSTRRLRHLQFQPHSGRNHSAWGNALTSCVEKSRLNSHTKRRAQFAVSLLTDALSPTNTLLGNPASLKR